MITTRGVLRALIIVLLCPIRYARIYHRLGGAARTSQAGYRQEKENCSVGMTTHLGNWRDHWLHSASRPLAVAQNGSDKPYLQLLPHVVIEVLQKSLARACHRGLSVVEHNGAPFGYRTELGGVTAIPWAGALGYYSLQHEHEQSAALGP